MIQPQAHRLTSPDPVRTDDRRAALDAPVHPMLAAAFETLERAGVRWSLLRGEADLAAPGGDVDLLVARADLARVRQLLAGLEFAPLPTWGRGSHTFFLNYHPPTDAWFKLDVVTDLSYGRHFQLRARVEAGCLARRRRVGPVSLLAPDDAFWTLLLHSVLDKGVVAPHRAARLQELAGAARTDGPLAHLVETACPNGWDAARLVAAARRGDWAALADLGPALAAAWTRRDPVGARSRALVDRVLGRLERSLIRLERVWRRRGVSVALLGPDGAGKSTLAAGIARSFYVPVRSVYMGLWRRGPVRPTSLGGSSLGPARALELASRVLKIWPRYLSALYHQALGRVVIFDRYTYDALLPRDCLTRPKRLYYWLLAHACPAPDLVLVLDAPGEVMYARKGEHSPELLETQRRQFLALRQQIPRLQVVDVTRAEDAVRADVVGRIWRRYAAGSARN